MAVNWSLLSSGSVSLITLAGLHPIILASLKLKYPRLLFIGYGATNSQDIEEGLRRLASILKKMEFAHRSRE